MAKFHFSGGVTSLVLCLSLFIFVCQSATLFSCLANVIVPEPHLVGVWAALGMDANINGLFLGMVSNT